MLGVEISGVIVLKFVPFGKIKGIANCAESGFDRSSDFWVARRLTIGLRH
jgi:hypothetical protein